MASWKKLFLVPLIFYFLSGCLGLPENVSSDELEPETVATEDSAPEGGGDEFAEFDDPATENQAPAEPTVDQVPTESVETAPIQDQPPVQAEQDEFAEFEQPPPDQTQPEQAAKPTTVAENAPPLDDEFDLDKEEPAAPQTEVADTTTATTATPQGQTTSQIEDIDPFLAPDPGLPAATAPQQAANVKIKSIQYKANDSGGAILIQADGPFNFVTRNNPDTEQLVVEIPGAYLPDRLKRPFNMRDIRGAFGSLDPYQQKGSNVARFVVQLRPNTSDPFVTAEGDTLIIVADKSQVANITSTSIANPNAKPGEAGSTSAADKILTSRTLQEFLAENSKFYGKKISIETSSMAVRDALRFISEEGGVNMIIADNVTGNVSLKLRDIPWDQAFVIIMKSKSLGYIRQGNVLRVATLADLRSDEDATIKLATDRIKIEPLIVKVFAINYAKVDDLAGRVKEFLTERGKAIGDLRTNSIVITDIRQSLDRIEQLIQNLDTQPPQVLIEGRIIEATDSFQRQIGMNWGFSGGSIAMGKSKSGDTTLRPSLNIATQSFVGSSLGINISTLDIFGSLNAQLNLAEVENKIRILSSPRIVTLSNEKASINQIIQRPYTTITTAGGVVTPQVVFKNLELLLEVTPQITSDASVIMAIKVKRDLVGELVDTLASIESREANTKVMVKNGQTSVIGGVYQNDSSTQNAGVPWLKDIPVLGHLFKFTDNRNRRTELMIFLTPRIVSAGSDSVTKNAAN